MSNTECVVSQEETLALLQRVALNITSEIDRICKKHSIAYSLVFGSLIGAVRHKGFIPWDDDLDLVMPRPDFERFLEVASAELPEEYELQDYRLGNSERYVTRVVDNRLLLKLESYAEGNILPAWVDIFVVDGLPEKQPFKSLQRLRIQWHKGMCAFASFDSTVNRNRPGRPAWQQMVINLYEKTHFAKRLNLQKELEKYDKVLRKYPFTYSSYCCCGVGSYSPKRQTWKRDCLERLAEYEFEDRVFYGPEKYDDMLSVIYGDYMTLPPEDARVVHTAEVYRNNIDV